MFQNHQMYLKYIFVKLGAYSTQMRSLIKMSKQKKKLNLNFHAKNNIRSPMKSELKIFEFLRQKFDFKYFSTSLKMKTK